MFFFFFVPRHIPNESKTFDTNLKFDISVYFVLVYQGTYLTEIKSFQQKFKF